MPEKVYVELSDGRKGWCIVTEERPDGSLVVVPDKSKETRLPGDTDDAAHSIDPDMLAAYRAESREIELGFQAPIPSGSLYLWQRR